MSMGGFAQDVHLNVSSRLWGSASRQCIHYPRFLSAAGPSQWHCEVSSSCFGLRSWNSGPRANSPSSNFYPSLLFPASVPFLPPSAPLFLVSWRGYPDVKGDLDRIRERERERDRNPHPPGDRLHCPRPFWTRHFRHIHTNNYARQTIESL